MVTRDALIRPSLRPSVECELCGKIALLGLRGGVGAAAASIKLGGALQDALITPAISTSRARVSREPCPIRLAILTRPLAVGVWLPRRASIRLTFTTTPTQGSADESGISPAAITAKFRKLLGAPIFRTQKAKGTSLSTGEAETFRTALIRHKVCAKVIRPHASSRIA